jgi:6-phosphogluconolactonase
LTKTQGIITYIGTYTRRESFVDGKAEGIYIYHLDPDSGELTYAATVTGESMVNPSFLTVSPDRRFLYAVNEIGGDKGPHGTVSAFAVDPATGGLRYLNQQSTHGLAPCYVHIEPEGRYCLVANYETGNLGVLPIQKDGRLWARQLTSFSSPALGLIRIVRQARMPTWCCPTRPAPTSWSSTWGRTG